MEFDELLLDIEKLFGLELKSIRPGANIIVDSIDKENGRIIIRTKDNQTKSRPISELQKIWENLCVYPAVRVENALQGAGSSRNHPETIMANLPYIEWLLIDGKKHICLMDSKTHAYGTLRKMEDIQAEAMRENMKLREDSNLVAQIIIVATNISKTATKLQSLTGQNFKPLDEGIYQLTIDKTKIILATPQTLALPPGSYSILQCKNHLDAVKTVNFLGKSYSLIHDDESKILTIQI